MILGTDLPCLPRMYGFMIFSLPIQVILSYPHLFIYVPLMSHDEKPTLITYLPNALCKDSITKVH